MIITEYEVVRYSPADRTFPMDVICQRIDTVEEKIGREKLGYDFFAALVADKAATPTGAEWVECGDYALDDVVLKDGVYYKSTAANNNTDPLDDGSSWVQYDKFSTSCYNTMWSKYLRAIFAYTVLADSIPFATRRVTGAGLLIQERDERGRRSGTNMEIQKQQEWLKLEADTIYRNMNAWLFNDDSGKLCAEALPEGCLLVDGFPGPAEPIRQRRVLYKSRRPWIQ